MILNIAHTYGTVLGHVEPLMSLGLIHMYRVVHKSLDTTVSHDTCVKTNLYLLKHFFNKKSKNSNAEGICTQVAFCGRA